VKDTLDVSAGVGWAEAVVELSGRAVAELEGVSCLESLASMLGYRRQSPNSTLVSSTSIRLDGDESSATRRWCWCPPPSGRLGGKAQHRQSQRSAAEHNAL